MSRTNVLPTVVLVHGALTDASVWNGVAARLLEAGHHVLAPAMPMRGLHSDAGYLNGYLSRIEGPVILVGHSWAGAVISHPKAVASADVKALVFVSAFQPDTGEAAGALNELFPGTGLTPENLEAHPNPLGGDDLTLRADKFGAVYAGDVPSPLVDVLSVSQRAIDPAALGETFAGTPTWRSIPSWAVVTTEDHSLPPQVLWHMAKRAGSTVVEVKASHAVPISQPDAVTDLITSAIDSLA
jgi:pimeloyl-ACP methyl ester carboxylesterase